MDNGIPEQIGRYKIDRLLGAGAMGFVYLGHDPELDRSVAIKTLRDLGMGEEALKTFLERFRNEARAAASLQHPSIVQVYDVGEQEDVGPYMVFEYVPGSTLKQVLKSRGALPPNDLMMLAENIAGAIDTAHAANVIHRDIKPDNLLVTDDGRTKLADFGVARVPNAALTREGQFLGTPCYAAPETLSSGIYGPKTDLFSFGAVLYEAISGTRAFPGTDAVAVAHKVIHDHPPPPSEAATHAKIPKELDEVITRAISKDATERYGSALELVDALRQAYAAAGVALDDPREPSRSFVTRVDPERRSSPAAFIAVLLGALAIGVAVVFAFSNTSPVPLEVDGGDVEAAIDAGVDARAETRDAQPTQADVIADGQADREVVEANEDAAVDSGLPLVANEDPEEAAKDAIGRARSAIRLEQWDRARRELDAAAQLDPGNGDIATLRATLPEE